MKKLLRGLILYIFLAGLFMLLLTAKGMKISTDSQRYLWTADFFSQGQWQEGLDVVLPYHPPLYPAVLAFVQKIMGKDLAGNIGLLPIQTPAFETERWTRQPFLLKIGWVRIVSILGFMGSVAGIFFLGWYLGGNVLAHLSAILFLFFHPLFSIFTWAWSETLFLPISIFSLLFIFLYGKTGKWFYLISSAVLVALGFLTRFSGISLILAGGIGIILFAKWNPLKIIIWGLIVALPLFGYMTLERDIQTPPYGFFHYVWDFLKVLYYDLAPVGVILLIYSFFIHKNMWWGVGLYALIYSFTLLIVKSTVAIDGIGTRLLCPIYPIILLYISLVLVRLFKKGYIDEKSNK